MNLQQLPPNSRFSLGNHSHSQFLDYFLNSEHLEEWFQKIPEKGKVFGFFESQKAQHAHKFETLDFYMQNAIYQMKNITSQFNEFAREKTEEASIILAKVKQCKSCMEHFINMVEQIPHHVQEKVHHMFNMTFQNRSEPDSGIQLDYIEPKIKKMKTLIQ